MSVFTVELATGAVVRANIAVEKMVTTAKKNIFFLFYFLFKKMFLSLYGYFIRLKILTRP